MLGFFRRITQSRFGIIITFGILAIIALAFAVGDVTGLQAGTTAGAGGSSVVRIGDQTITPAQLRSRVQTELEGFRQQQPTLDIATFVAQGGYDGTLDRMVAGIALEEFGRDMGMVASKKAVDGEIASIPGLQGPNGKFDPALYRRILIERKLTDAQVRGDVARDLLAQQLTGPTAGATQVPTQLALPYAALLLERRTGQVGIVPVSAVAAGPAPSDADIQTFYRRGLSRYSLPERRVVRYALVTPRTGSRPSPRRARRRSPPPTAPMRVVMPQRRSARSSRCERLLAPAPMRSPPRYAAAPPSPPPRMPPACRHRRRPGSRRLPMRRRPRRRRPTRCSPPRVARWSGRCA